MVVTVVKRASRSFSTAGLKISLIGPSDKMSDDFEFGSDICPMTFSSVWVGNKSE